MGAGHVLRLREGPARAIVGAVDDHQLESIRALSAGRYWGHMGIEFLEVSPGRSVCRIQLQDQHLNYNDVVHGGVVSGLIDAAAGTAVRTLRTPEEVAERPHATSDLHVSYLSAASGRELVARGRVIKAGRTALFVDVEVHDDRSRMVARGSVTFVIGPPRPALRDTE